MDITTLANSTLLLSQWHPTKNGGMPFVDVKVSSVVWWKCVKGHEWEAKVANRIKGSGCVFCSNQKVLVGFNDLATTHPELALEWHSSKNGAITPQTVIAGSEKKAWWVCSEGHEWEAVLHSRAGRKIGCPVCSGNKVLAGFNDLATLFPKVAMEWNTNKNGVLTPQQVSVGSNKKVWWVCSVGHEYETPVARRTQEKSSGCVFCSNQKVLTGFNDLATTHPWLVKEWNLNKNGDLSPQNVIAGTGKSISWVCDKGHEWNTIGAARVKTSPSGCPICSGNKVLVGFNDLGTVLPLIAAEWNYTRNGDITPQQMTSGSNMRAWWVCNKDENHEWEATIANRSNRLSGCPHCVYHVNKSETELYNYICSLNIGLVQQSVRSLITPYEVDIYVPEKKLAIEYNGIYWHSEDKGKGKDYHINKWKACKEQDIQLIQIWEDDWNRNPELIKRMLEHKLGVSQQARVYARKTEVKVISKQEAEKFLVENHLQGFRASTFYYGLFDNSSGLVAVLSTLMVGSVAEIARFASSVTVIGGFSKLLKFALKGERVITKVVTYSHNDYATGQVYENNGFVRVHDGQPNYSYIVDGIRKHRLNFTKTKFKSNPNLKYKDNLTENELANLNGLIRVWDAGSSFWSMDV